MATPPEFSGGSLYLAGFAQVRAPHAGLIIASSAASGILVHIVIDRDTSEFWTYQCRWQKVAGDIFMTTLLKLHDISDGPITQYQLEEVASSISAPSNDTFGECLLWVMRVVEKLTERGLVKVADIAALEEEFEEFARKSKAYATSTRFPNTTVSQYC